MKLTDSVKNIFLAGVGAVAITGEKSKEVIDTLVKQGEITVEEGKTLNSDIAKKIQERSPIKPEKFAKAFRDTLYNVDKMTKEERDELRKKLDEADKAAEPAAEAEEVGAEPVAEAEVVDAEPAEAEPEKPEE